MRDLILRQEDIDRFNSTLEKLTKKTHVALTVLVHRDGHLLASAGETDAVDTTALSALVSANFSSTVAIANLVGEKEFTTQHHSGRDKCILVSLIDDYSFLVAVFDMSIPLEPIRVFTDEYRPELVKALDKLYRNEPEPLGADEAAAPEQLEEVMDAEEVARQAKAKGESAAQVVPRRLSYTTKPPREREAEPVAAEAASRQRVIREPDADEADLEALANAISSRREREKKPAVKSAAPADVLMVDGKPMNVVSLKNRKQTKSA